jgi:hypothetical protein
MHFYDAPNSRVATERYEKQRHDTLRHETQRHEVPYEAQRQQPTRYETQERSAAIRSESAHTGARNSHISGAKYGAPPKQRYAGYFNERRSTAPKFSTASRFGAKRVNDDDDGTPGPAAYRTDRTTLRPAKQSGVSFPRASRMTERVSDIIELEDTPGPGAYNTAVSSFAKVTARRSASAAAASRRNQASRPAHVDPFGSMSHAARTHDDDNDTPGPGAYRVAKASQVVLKHAPVACIPRAARFDNVSYFGRRIDPDEPSALSYAPRSTRRQDEKHVTSRAGTIAKASRFSTRRMDDDDLAPGPGAYTPLYGLL